MKNSLHKMIWRTFLVLACTMLASNAWADDVYSVLGNNNDIFGGTGTDDVTNTLTEMSLSDNNIYTWTSGVFEITSNNWVVKYKVVKNHDYSQGEWPYGYGNYAQYTINNTGKYTMSFYLNTNTNPYTAEAHLNNIYTVLGNSAELFGSLWNTGDFDNTGNDMTWSGTWSSGSYVWTKKNVNLSAGTIEYKVCQNHQWGSGEFPSGNESTSIAETGTYDVTITYNENSSLTFTAVPVKSLKDICGVTTTGGDYRISDELVAVDYIQKNNNVYLWCKDNNNAATQYAPAQGVTDFMRKGQNAPQKGEWDQSNWVVLKLTGNGTAALAKAVDAKGHKISGVTGKLIDATNYTLESDINFTIGAEASYTPNVYCVANFNSSNWGNAGVTSTVDNEKYFFMTPKINEICKITSAKWDGSKFVCPAETGFSGQLTLGWDLNSAAQANVTLTEGQFYEFNSVVRLSGALTAPSLKDVITGGGVVYPTNLTGDANIVTGINTIAAGKGEVKAVRYYNLMGVESATPFDGVNIVVKEFSDGTRETSKVVK